MRKLVLLLSLSVLFVQSANGQSTKFQGDVCYLPAPPPDFSLFMKNMTEKIYRNLPSSVPQSKDTTVKFFLTEDGSIRDARIFSGSIDYDVDTQLLDAVYSASPVGNPPMWRTPLPPPPSSTIMAPNDHGIGAYKFVFKKTTSDLARKSDFKYRYSMVPLEVFYRYPGAYTLDELRADTNQIDIHPSSDNLENARFQWSEFYKNNKTPNRGEISAFAWLVFDKFLSKSAATQ